MLFCLHRQTRRSETVASGLLSGFAMTVPFALTFLCLMRFWPNEAVFGAEVPWLVMLDTATGGSRFWTVVFGIVVGWTLLETAVGGIHALVDRVEHNIDDLPRFLRPESGELTPMLRAGASVGVLLAAMGLASFGIIDLVAKGYGLLSWGFIVFMALPLLVVGSYRMLTTPGQLTERESLTCGFCSNRYRHLSGCCCWLVAWCCGCVSNSVSRWGGAAAFGCRAR